MKICNAVNGKASVARILRDRTASVDGRGGAGWFKKGCFVLVKLQTLEESILP